MTFLLRLTPVLLTVPLAFGAGCARKTGNNDEGVPSADPQTTTPISAPKPAPPSGPIQHISGPNLLKKIAASGAKGTIVNAWASWCGPCRREFPMLVALQDNLSSKGIQIIFVSVDEADGEPVALEFAKERGVSAPILVAERPLGPFKEALNPKWPGMLPATFLFDSTGKLRYFWGGPVYENELLPIIEGFLSGESIDGEANFGLSPGKDFRHE